MIVGLNIKTINIQYLRINENKTQNNKKGDFIEAQMLNKVNITMLHSFKDYE